MDNWKYDEEEDEVEIIDDVKKINYEKLSVDNIERIEHKFNKATSFPLNFAIAFILFFVTTDFAFTEDFSGRNWLYNYIKSVIVVFSFDFISLMIFVIIGNAFRNKMSIKAKNIYAFARDIICVLLFALNFTVIAICFNNWLYVTASIFACVIVIPTLIIVRVVLERSRDI